MTGGGAGLPAQGSAIGPQHYLVARPFRDGALTFSYLEVPRGSCYDVMGDDHSSLDQKILPIFEFSLYLAYAPLANARVQMRVSLSSVRGQRVSQAGSRTLGASRCSQ